MVRIWPKFPGAVERSAEIAGRITFDLSQLRYEYPDEPVPPGDTAIHHLRRLTSQPADPVADATSHEDVQVSDPLAASATGFVSLFKSTSAALTSGSAGTDGVQYTFSLDSGDYRTTYQMGSGALAPNNVAGFNPEHSSVTTAAYQLKYSDRWLNDGLDITVGSATGADLLERGRFQCAPGVCGRSESTEPRRRHQPLRGGLRHQPQRTGADDPLGHRRQQRAVHREH